MCDAQKLKPTLINKQTDTNTWIIKIIDLHVFAHSAIKAAITSIAIVTDPEITVIVNDLKRLNQYISIAGYHS